MVESALNNDDNNNNNDNNNDNNDDDNDNKSNGMALWQFWLSLVYFIDD